MKEQKEFNTNGLTNYAIDKISDFQDGLKELYDNGVPFDVIFEYVEQNKTHDDISEDIYKTLDQLKLYETEAIKSEIPVMSIQAEDNGLELPKIIQKVNSLEAGDFLKKIPAIVNFSNKALEKIPNLKVFTPFIWIPEQELEKLKPAEENANEIDFGFEI